MNISVLLETRASEQGAQNAIIQGQEHISFQQLCIRSRQGAHFLQKLGIKKGDKVLVFVPMSIELYIILMSLWRLGATAMFLDPSSGRRRITACCQKAPPKGFIGTTKAQLLRLIVPALRKIPIALSTGFPFLSSSWAHHHRTDSSELIIDLPENTPALITFTSGSTGTPKATVRTHGFLLEQKKVLEHTLALQPEAIDLATLPVFALINLACGVTTLIPSVDLSRPAQVNPESILDDIARYQPKTAVASPAFYNRLLSAKQPERLKCITTLFTGGAPVFPDFLEKMHRLIPETELVAVYGSTEAEPVAELYYREIREEDKKSMAAGGGLLAGTVIDRINCRVIKDKWGTPLEKMNTKDFDSLEQPAEVPGEIVVSGSHVLPGYLDGVGDAETKIHVEDIIWHRTGDLGFFDTEGRLWLLGRCTAKITDHKGTVYPFCIETAAMQLPEVEKAALCLVNNKRLLVVESSCLQKEIETKLAVLTARFDIDSVLCQTIPMDKRHNAKVDYPALRTSLGGKAI